MNNLIKSLDSINNFSKKIILRVSIIVLVACVISICLITYNGLFIGEATLYTLGTTLLKKSLYILSWFCIAALTFDLLDRAFKNGD